MRIARIFVPVFVFALAFGLVRQADAGTFTIDSTESFLSIEVGGYEDDGSFTSITTAQLPGSDSTSLFGTLEVQYGSGNIGISSGSIGFNNQPTDMEPGDGGTLPGSGPAAYGLAIDLLGAVFGPGAVRGVTADLALGSVPLAGNSFDANGALITLTSGLLDVNLQGALTIVTQVDITGNSGSNTGGGATLDLVGLDGTLLIPLFVEADVPVEIAPGSFIELVARFDGQIKSIGVVPEPGTFGLLGIGGIGLCVTRRRRVWRA